MPRQRRPARHRARPPGHLAELAPGPGAARDLMVLETTSIDTVAVLGCCAERVGWPVPRRQTYPLLVVYGVFGPIELVLSGVSEVLLSAHTRAHDPEAAELVRDSLRRANRRMLRNAVMSISLRREDLTDLLPEIATPTLLITGSDHSGFTPAQAEAAARLTRDVRTAVVPDAAYLCAPRGADNHIDAHPRVLGTVCG